MVAFAAPVVFLLLLEGVLGLCDAGYPTSFFVRSERRGNLTTNNHFGWHYQQETLAEPQPCLIPIDKPKDAIRVFVLGESAAMGTPDPAFGFARILEVMLRRLYPERRIEVVNAAMRGINSHIITQIAKECAGLDPDLFLVYVGNSEFTGLYGPKTSLGFLAEHPTWIPIFHQAKRMRTGQLLRRTFGANPEARQRRRLTHNVSFFQDRRTALDDPARACTYRNFRRNLERICRHGADAGAGVVVATIGVNLRDCPPLGSLHREGLTASQQEQWERLCREGMQSEAAGDVAQALSRYQQALEIDDHHAELHFRVAGCRLRLGDCDAAAREFSLARDWDALQFRADSRINEIIRDVAGRSASPQVRLVEIDEALARSEPCLDGIPGKEFFHEHIHLCFAGDFQVARAVLPAIVECLRQRGTAPAESAEVPGSEQCARELVFTPWDEVNTAAAMAKLTAHPPFTGQLDHAHRQATAEKAVATVMERVDEQFINQVLGAYRGAIAARPDDWVLRYNLGIFLRQLQRPREAAVCFEQVVQMVPDAAPFRVLLGHTLGQAGSIDEAVRQFREALKRDPRYEPAREGLVWAEARKRLGRSGQTP
jgi:tetratricopeptide (TPR) repeat protein